MFFYSPSVDISTFALKTEIPQPSTVTPSPVADSSVIGDNLKYALANHTHASKVRKERVQSAADGTFTWTYSTPFASGVIPRIVAIAEVASGVTDVVNVQIVDTPTNVSCKLLVNRANKSVASLIGLTVLSIPSQPGATWVHCAAFEP